MTTLYPIGTQLITRRLSQAALYVELFSPTSTEFASFFDPDDEVDQRYLVGFCSIADEWRVTVTEENQKWLSPVPIVGDMMFPCVIQGQDGIFGALVNNPSSLYWYRKERKVVLRMYPNDQFAPLIKWDEVILPEETAA